jgi:hypothetical protein
MRCAFSIIVPTCGRRSLARTLASLKNQVAADKDEVLLVTDGCQPHAARLFAASGLPGRCIEMAATHDYGGTQRNRGMDEARGDYLLFMDDDDIYTPDALETVRTALHDAPGCPHLFRMRYAADGRVLWHGRDLVLGNVSTQMIVFPNQPNLKRWDSLHGHDHRFIVNNLPLWPPGSLVWREEVISVVRPHESQPADISECFYRQDIRENAGVEIAQCRLLEQICGPPARHCDVRRDACESCCRSFPPSPVAPNPVIASLLYRLVGQMLSTEQTNGHDYDALSRIQLWAEAHLGGW